MLTINIYFPRGHTVWLTTIKSPKYKYCSQTPSTGNKIRITYTEYTKKVFYSILLRKYINNRYFFVVSKMISETYGIHSILGHISLPLQNASSLFHILLPFLRQRFSFHRRIVRIDAEVRQGGILRLGPEIVCAKSSCNQLRLTQI